MAFSVTLCEGAVALAMELQGSSLKTLEAAFAQNQSFNRQAQKTFESVQSLVQNSKLTNKGSGDFAHLIELLAFVRHAQELIWGKF